MTAKNKTFKWSMDPRLVHYADHIKANIYCAGTTFDAAKACVLTKSDFKGAFKNLVVINLVKGYCRNFKLFYIILII